MRNAVYYLTAGALVTAAGFIAHPVATGAAAIAIVVLVHHVWVDGHVAGWREGCVATAQLADTLTTQARNPNEATGG